MHSTRKFTIGDMMGLVAAAALGLALDRWRVTELVIAPPATQGQSVGASNWIHVLGNGRPSCYVVALALVLIPLRWLPRRPPAVQVLRQPGAVACLAIVWTIAANFAVLALDGVIYAATRGPSDPITTYSNWYYWSQALHWLSMGVGGAWVALALGGRWSPEKSWIDRTGVALGVYWIATYFLGYFSEFVDFLLPYKA